METATIIPAILFIAGIIAIFISGGNTLYMIAGDAAVFLSGIAIIKVQK